MKFLQRLSLVALLGCATALTPLGAQTVADEAAPEVSLNIRDGQQLFGTNDPNVRRATARVNGEVITGTDIDHRLALILAANDNKLPDEEVARFRAQIISNLIDETLYIQEAAANEIEVTDAEINQVVNSAMSLILCLFLEHNQDYKREIDHLLTSLGFKHDQEPINRVALGHLTLMFPKLPLYRQEQLIALSPNDI